MLKASFVNVSVRLCRTDYSYFGMLHATRVVSDLADRLPAFWAGRILNDFMGISDD